MADAATPPTPADPMDPRSVPDPAGGWTTTIRTVPDAVVAHIAQGYLVHPSGVFDAQGVYVHEAVHWRGRPLMTEPPRPDGTDHLPGRWLWGGVLMEHFGHFLTESTGRLWALDHLEGPVDGIVFLPEKGFGKSPAPQIKAYQTLFLHLLGIDLPVRVLSAATRIDRLEVPGPGFGIGPLMTGTDRFRQFIHTRLARDIAPSGGENLYISRSALDLSLGGILGERVLERHLTAAGYEIYHPQDHSLPDQIARYRAARRVISLDGSALHLLAMVAPPDQSVALIKRRKGVAPEGIIRHLSAFTGRQPTVIDVLDRSWVRSDRQKADNYSYGELDFHRLGKVLLRNGFLPDGTVWPSMPRRRLLAAVDWLQKRLRKRGLTFAPHPPLPNDPSQATAGPSTLPRPRP